MDDKDLRRAIYFMISLATVIEEMTQDLIKGSEMHIDYEKYEKKIARHETTYDNLFENFVDDVFGEFANRAEREDFKAFLSSEGWKYFDLYSLNGIFKKEFDKLSEEEKAEILLINNDDQ